MGLNHIPACLRLGAGAGPKKAFGLGAMIFFLSVSSAPAYAQDTASLANYAVQRSADVDPITVTGRMQKTVVPNVFGTVAVPFGATPMSARWTRVMSAPVNEPALIRFTAGARTYTPLQKVSFVQSAINRTVRNFHTPKCTDDGYWAAARESLARRGGDCVDIAIAKMEALRQLGIPVRDLYLITGRMFTGSMEAALLVRLGDQFWLLDARSDQIRQAGQASGFTPIVTYGVGMTWAHGVQVRAGRGGANVASPQQIAARPKRSESLASRIGMAGER